MIEDSLKKLSKKLHEVLPVKFPGVVCLGVDEKTQDHENHVTGIRLAPTILKESEILSEEFIGLILSEMESHLNFNDLRLEEFIELKAIDRIGTGMYYNVVIVGKFKK